MNILVVDYICTRGHIFFNKIHLNALVQTNHKFTYVSRKGYLEVPENSLYYEIPEEFYIHQTQNKVSSLTYLMYEIKKLLFVKNIINVIKPDAVVVLTYDELSLAFFRVKCPTFIVNHANVDLMNIWYRKLFMRFLPSNFIHVCLTKRIYEYMKISCKQNKIVYVPHGCLFDNPRKSEKTNIIFAIVENIS